MADPLHCRPRKRAALLAILACSIARLLPSAEAQDIVVADGDLLTVSSLMDITGVASATHVVKSDNANDRHFAFKITGALGSLRAQGGIRVGTTTTLLLDNSVSYSGVAGGRLSDTAPLELDSAKLEYVNERLPAVNLTETIGALRIGGYSRLEMGSFSTSDSYGSTTLIADRLERMNRGTFEVTFTRTLGSGTTGAAYVRLNNAPATTAGGVVPYATAQIAAQTAPYGVVVYEPANGLRLLGSAEYINTFAGATAASDVLLASGATFTNNTDLTVRTLTVSSATTINGTGSITLAGGLLLHLGTTGTVDNPIAFGSQEAFIAVPYENNNELTFLKPVTGSGGLTVYGRSIVGFDGGNQISGDLVLNGEARIRIDEIADLGPATTPIQINGVDTGAGIRTTATMNFTRPVQVNSGYFSVSPRAGTLTLSGGISGGGGVFVPAGAGEVLLSGVNTYTGPTMVEGNLTFTSDAAFGNSSSIILAEGTIRLSSNWTTARLLQHRSILPSDTYLDTNGFDVNFQGNFSSSSSLQSLIKTGAGRFFITVPVAPAGMSLQVSEGEIVVQDGGALSGVRLIAATGGTVIVDQRAGAVDRGQLDVVVGGGEYRVLGHATQSSTLHGKLTASGPYGLATVVAGNAPILMDLTNLVSSNANWVVLRAPQLGGSSGGYTRLRFSTVPTLANGIVLGLLADSSLTGFGQSFTTYDTTSDAGGVIGVRALKATEYISTPTLRNPANGGSTPTTANFLASGVVSVPGLANTVNTLTLAPGSRLDLAAGQSLTISQKTLLVPSGAMAEIAGGGTILPTSALGAMLTIVGEGDLRLGATVPTQGYIVHAGPGRLVVTGRQPENRVYINNGTLEAGAGDPMRYSDVVIGLGAQFNLLGTTTSVGYLGGLGTVDPGGGTLQLAGNTTSGGFPGQLAGTGAFLSLRSGGVSLTGASPSFTGTVGTINGGLTITGTLPNIAGLTLRGGSVHLDYATAASAAPRVGVVPVDIRSGTLTLTAVPSADTAATFTMLTGEGLSRLVIFNGGTGTGTTEGRITLASLERRNRGTFNFSTSVSSNRTARFDILQDLTPALIGDTGAATSQPVLPYATFNGHPATYTPGVGLRALTASEQVSTFITGQNVKTTVSGVEDFPVAVNSYEMASSSVVLSGAGTLQVASGVTILQGSLRLILDFGQVEGQVFLPTSASGAQITKSIRGSNGVTITANGNNLALTGANTFTGPLTINGAKVNFNAAAALGADASPVVLAGGYANYDGSNGTPYTLARGFDLRGAGGHLTTSSSYLLTLTGPISGPGDLYLSNVELGNTAGTYTGTTYVDGNVRFGSDAVFGQSPGLETAGTTTFVLLGGWSSARGLRLEQGTLLLNTGAFDAMLNGPLSGDQQLTKSGAGLLTIANGEAFDGPLRVSGGTVRLASDLGTRQYTVTVDVAGRLEGSATLTRPIALNGTLAPGTGTAVGVIESNNLTMAGASRLELEMTAADAFDQLRVDGTVTLNGLVQLSLGISGVSGAAFLQWPILLNDGTDAITVSATKAFAINSTVLTEGATFNVSGFNATITYKGGDGNDVYLTIPEPGSGALGALGLLGLLARRPARRR